MEWPVHLLLVRGGGVSVFKLVISNIAISIHNIIMYYGNNVFFNQYYGNNVNIYM